MYFPSNFQFFNKIKSILVQKIQLSFLNFKIYYYSIIIKYIKILKIILLYIFFIKTLIIVKLR